MKQPVLVIGAAHLDIVGEYGSSVSGVIDKPGEIFYSVGGTAYNIAANLAQNGARVRFMTGLRRDSLVEPIISARLQSYGILTDLIVRSSTAEESGFIAQREDGKLVSAVTATTMDNFSCSEEVIADAIRSSEYVVCDCNVSSSFLNRLARLCKTENRKLILSLVSERKAARSQQITRDAKGPLPYFMISMNEEEARALNCPTDDSLPIEDVIGHCKRFGAENILVTKGPDGFVCYNQTGDIISRPAPLVTQVVSVTGAGDALLSAVCESLYRKQHLDWEDIEPSIARLVADVLARKGATVGARTNPEEMKVVPREELRRLEALEKDHLIAAFGRPVQLFGRKVPLGELVGIGSLIVGLLTFLVGL